MQKFLNPLGQFRHRGKRHPLLRKKSVRQSVRIIVMVLCPEVSVLCCLGFITACLLFQTEDGWSFMAIYLFSDDHYFSFGLTRLLQKEHLTLKCYGWEEWGPQFTQFNVFPGDILLLDGSTTGFTKHCLCFPLNQQVAKIFIFRDRHKGLIPIFTRWQHGDKDMPYGVLRQQLHRLLAQSALQNFCPGRLTERESQILLRLCNKLPYYRIARDLTLSVKTISAHKINALRKLGVGSIHEILN
ncbi:helix-turn-helix domain-containing protein [Enterobacteriaceae bacterium C23F]